MGWKMILEKPKLRTFGADENVIHLPSILLYNPTVEQLFSVAEDLQSIVNELASKIVENIKDSINIGVEQWSDDILYTLDGSLMCGDSEGFDDIDALIVRLKELTNPQSKYNIGDEAFYLQDNEIESFIIQDITGDLIRLWGNGFCIAEQNCYPTKQDIINAQIAYWQNISCTENSDSLTRDDCHVKEMKKCVHESDGQDYCPGLYEKVLCSSELTPKDLLRFNKCKHCGEFYR